MSVRSVFVFGVLSLTVGACGSPSESSPSVGRTSPTSPAVTSTTPDHTPSSTTSVSEPATIPVTTASQIDANVEVIGNCQTPSVEPTELILTCADHGTVFENLRWTTWTATSATAVGTGSYSHCGPDCPTGHLDVAGVQVTLTTPVKGVAGELLFSEIQENPEPPGFETGPYRGGPQPLPTRPT
jgi:hypothetical protein